MLGHFWLSLNAWVIQVRRPNTSDYSPALATADHFAPRHPACWLFEKP